MTISVLDFGAKPNTKEIQTTYFQKALDYCYDNGGGTVIVPEGEYLIGSIQIKSNTTFYLKKNAKLTSCKDLSQLKLLQAIPVDEFLPEVHTANRERLRNWHCALIHIYKSQNVSIIGEENSIIDGQNLFNPNGEENYRGPHLISALYGENLLFKGYTAMHSANWCHCEWLCKNVKFDAITILGGHDGIDVFGSDNIELINCKILTGDDCIAGYDNRNVTIKDCTLNSSCSAFRFGGKNVLIENCYVYGPGEYIHRYSLTQQEKESSYTPTPNEYSNYRHNLTHFFKYYADHRLDIRDYASNILVKNCKIDNCDALFNFAFDENMRWQCNKPMQNITFENVEINGVKRPLQAIADEKVPFELTIKNSKIDFDKDYISTPFIESKNSSKLTFENLTTNNDLSTFIIDYGKQTQVEIKNGNINKDIKRQTKDYSEYCLINN